MKLYIHENGTVEVALSRRNLLALLHKLDWPGSARTIAKDLNAGVLIVVAEDDAGHYGETTPGVMHPVTEAAIR